MTRLLATLARTVSKVAPGSVVVTMTLDGVAVRRRGTWLRETRWARSGRSDDDIASEELVVVSRVAIPTEGLPRLPEMGDEITVDGSLFYAAYVLDVGATVHVGLARWRA